MILGRVGQMVYINTWMVNWGLMKTPLNSLVDLKAGTPTGLNRLLATGALDLAPVSSVAAAGQWNQWRVFDGFCIASRGEVGSVLLCSRVPVAELEGEDIAVTTESATSIRLLEILLREHWRVNARLVPGEGPARARLLIGDRALVAGFEDREVIYDLGAAWKALTGRGFVFGLWCVREAFAREHPDKTRALADLLRLSYEMGRMDRAALVKAASRKLGLPEPTISNYLDNLCYRLDDDLRSGLDLFLEYLGYPPRRLRFWHGEGEHHGLFQPARPDDRPGAAGAARKNHGAAESPAGDHGGHGPRRETERTGPSFSTALRL